MTRTGGRPLKTLVYDTWALILMLIPKMKINVQAGKHMVFNGLYGGGPLKIMLGPNMKINGLERYEHQFRRTFHLEWLVKGQKNGHRTSHHKPVSQDCQAAHHTGEEEGRGQGRP